MPIDWSMHKSTSLAIADTHGYTTTIAFLHASEIACWVDVDAQVDIWRKDDGDWGRLLEGADWVVDAIDNIQTKVDLLAYCHEHRLKPFPSPLLRRASLTLHSSSPSAPAPRPIPRASRSPRPSTTPCAQCVRASAACTASPLAYLWCTPRRCEQRAATAAAAAGGGAPEGRGVFHDFRVRILPVLGPLPVIFGLHIATRIPLDEDKTTSPSSSKTCTAGAPSSRPRRARLRWDLARPLGVKNAVVMDAGDAGRHLLAESRIVRWQARGCGARRVEEVERWREWVM
ncbi:ThiF domain-containing protein [Mycena venus]|uniref:ThiF domain-containing protein n=1 Tax=Mycena venus TaxID=2733690 RepID=A0A8H6XLY9_9AGAR|nr:ThiF domain-containing protein [Mycena venus]